MGEIYDIPLFIAGQWRAGSTGETRAVLNPATGEQIARLAVATQADLDEALAAAEAGFQIWKAKSALERAKILRRAADLMRERAALIGRLSTLEQGKPLAESVAEAEASGDIFDWYAEEARRAYGWIVPSKFPGVQHKVFREPVGPVAAFTPWNFPTTIPSRKMAAALAAGCSVILKPAEETPSCALELARCLDDAGLPKGVLNLVFGEPAEISTHLIGSDIIKKVSFTGSTGVGKHLMGLAAKGMKKTTMELGGHAPAVIFADADVEAAATQLARNKFRNAGQICITPTRFVVHESVHDQFVARFAQIAQSLTIGDGMTQGTTMGPLANGRRLQAMAELTADAVAKGATLVCGGERVGTEGFFFAPTILADVPLDADIMSVEPFGPIAVTTRFSTFDEAIAEANRLPYGLSAYVFSASGQTATRASEQIQAGMVGVNFTILTGPETPFGGIKDSGHGTEGGAEGLLEYMTTKYVAQA